jgi:hypothetical protein
MGRARNALETETLKLAVLVCVAVAGGTFSLILRELTLLKQALAGAGFVATILLVSFIWKQYRWLQREADKEDQK